MNVSDLMPDLRIIAGSLAVQWPGLDAQDIEQHMAERLVKRQDSLKGVERKIVLGFAKREGVEYCVSERYYYQTQTSEWIYTPREVRHLLATMFTESLHVDTPKRPSKGKEYLTADGVSVVLMDIRNAFFAVAESDRSVILSVFHDGESLEGATIRRRLDRAIDNVTNRLNWHMHSVGGERYMHDGPGSRQVMSNAAARFATGDNY